jgi:uncharacterized protein (DUF736 family)
MHNGKLATFTAQGNSFSGTLRTLSLNTKLQLTPS